MNQKVVAGSFEQKWLGNSNDLLFGDNAFHDALMHVHRPLFFVRHDGGLAVTDKGAMICGDFAEYPTPDALPLLAYIHSLTPWDLGDASFKADLGLKYAYIMGAMANGISSVEMVQAAGSAGMLGFFGAGGLPLESVSSAIDMIQKKNATSIFGFNLIHSPNDQALESAVVDLYLERRIDLVSASAYLGLTPALVRYRVKKIFQTPQGKIICPNKIMAKVSREEVARKFFSPPPETILRDLVRNGEITDSQAQLARHIPMAQDITAEADSGGHTDNRPAFALFPTIMAIRDMAIREYQYHIPLRVGLAGGIATPEATAAAFSMGAAYVLTGSINQACQEADTSATVRQMLCQAQQADVVMAPAADMFDLGAKVQVLKRGTMFAMRANKLLELYRIYERYETIPVSERLWIERDLLRGSFDQAWQQTCNFFECRSPDTIRRAERDPKFRMALVFRSYLGQASLWAKTGIADRQMDYQIWCGPSMGAFNAWVKGSFLEQSENRHVVLLAMNLLFGACYTMRRQWLLSQYGPLASGIGHFSPCSLVELDKFLVQ